MSSIHGVITGLP